MNALVWHFIQQTAKDNPNLEAIALPLRNNGQANLSGIQLSAFEYSLQTPWSDVDSRREASSLASWYFKKGASVTLFRPSAPNDEVGLLRSRKDFMKLQEILGTGAISSDYDLMAAEANTSPSQVHWWSSQKTKARSVFLLSMKAMDMLQSKQIYAQSSAEMHGFQFGDPAVPPYRIDLELFDRNDRRYRIWILSKSSDHPFITQAEVNALVASLKPIPHS